MKDNKDQKHENLKAKMQSSAGKPKIVKKKDEKKSKE